jgi:ATP-dependent Lon protease
MYETFKQMDLHVHFPAAATPKDGPSAGVTITVALVSLFTGRRVKSNFAMTGEISLKGLALPVGGIKEKCMAAHRNGINNIILPSKNKKDSKDIPEDLRSQLNLFFADHVLDYLDLALEKKIDKEYMRQNALNYGSPFEVKAKM